MADVQFVCPSCSNTAELKDAQYIGLGDNTVLEPFYRSGCHRPFCSDSCAREHYRKYYRSFHDPAQIQQGVNEGNERQIDDLRPLFAKWD
jgi:hypothetical protein